MMTLAVVFVLIFIHGDSMGQSGTTVEGPQGTFTYTQVIDQNSGSPYYTSPSNGGGFGIYSWFNQDYGWQHDFPSWTTINVNIISSTMTISAWDVDSEPFHGTGGEYDGLEVDGLELVPGLLQGENSKTSITTFDIPLSNIIDDGLVNIELDIDMNHTARTWATRLDYSLLEIVYTVESNTPPTISSITLNPSPDAGDEDALTVEVEAFDADGDHIFLTYRWYVDVGQGFYVDDEFANRNNHTGNTIPAADTQPGDRWKVDIIPTDSKGAIGEKASAEIIVREEFYLYYPSQTAYNTLAFEDFWPMLGDYDMNDLIVWYRITATVDASGEVLDILFRGELVARGAGFGNGFGLSFSSLEATDVYSANLNINGNAVFVSAENGHSGELVYILFNDARSYLPYNGIFNFYNTEAGDQRQTLPFQFSLELNRPKSLGILNTMFFNPFLIKDGNRDIEIHLPDHPPTDLADLSYFGTENDASAPENSHYYRSHRNLPWALNISTQWSHPLEGIDIILSYPDMATWIESNGNRNSNWYLSPDTAKVW